MKVYCFVNHATFVWNLALIYCEAVLVEHKVDLYYRWPVVSNWEHCYDEINQLVIHYTTCTDNQSN
jgi:hypothetical protein